MHVVGWLHQMDQQPSGDLVGQVGALGLDRLAVKALDGASWMAGFDKGVGAIGGIGDLVALEDRLENVGVGLDAWVNVTRAELSAASAIWKEILGSIHGRLFLDLEPYAGFWGDESDVGGVAAAIAGLDRSRLGVTFDPRRGEWVGLDRVMGSVAIASPQVYEFGWLSEAEQLVGRWGTSWEPLVSVQESVSEWLGVITSSSLKATSFGVWLLPIQDGAQRELLEVIHTGAPPGPRSGMADGDFLPWAPKTGRWREAAVNLKGIADDALECGRKVRDGVEAAVSLWGIR